MKQPKYMQNVSVGPRSGNYVSIFSALFLALSLGLGSVLSSGCVAAPAVVLTSAAVSVAALVSEGERAVQYPDGSSVIVQHDTGEESVCKQTCERRESPLEDDQPDA
jgi:hypothetical protein